MTPTQPRIRREAGNEGGGDALSFLPETSSLCDETIDAATDTAGELQAGIESAPATVYPRNVAPTIILILDPDDQGNSHYATIPVSIQDWPVLRRTSKERIVLAISQSGVTTHRLP